MLMRLNKIEKYFNPRLDLGIVSPFLTFSILLKKSLGSFIYFAYIQNGLIIIKSNSEI